jgi:hypothetical protein
VLNLDLPVVDLVFHKEELHLDVFSTFATRKFSVGLQKNSTLVILINRGMSSAIALFL